MASKVPCSRRRFLRRSPGQRCRGAAYKTRVLRGLGVQGFRVYMYYIFLYSMYISYKVLKGSGLGLGRGFIGRL